MKPVEVVGRQEKSVFDRLVGAWLAGKHLQGKLPLRAPGKQGRVLREGVAEARELEVASRSGFPLEKLAREPVGPATQPSEGAESRGCRARGKVEGECGLVVSPPPVEDGAPNDEGCEASVYRDVDVVRDFPE
jgi:hypothetical protein